ncbi:uncharacterized protein MYCFIDRAFT_172669 [Pseudocercospora fijiensis CIRAD86]|uniref:Uncharacterized protein n=1 Tax=Pseudocercospora fijiensis (strain CIRAD86) TaxID=383855 RepID=M3BCI8_PSEFD|nr:uncharacterized protein MYCFIDRAFT_172669 [Pseudocercospora fijiensis CIRAD86]EME86992.1 hypothetical protein MYCFIDRAFT_172669 [Pseudocercospora fijiensis CIRAD86]
MYERGRMNTGVHLQIISVLALCPCYRHSNPSSFQMLSMRHIGPRSPAPFRGFGAPTVFGDIHFLFIQSLPYYAIPARRWISRRSIQILITKGSYRQCRHARRCVLHHVNGAVGLTREDPKPGSNRSMMGYSRSYEEMRRFSIIPLRASSHSYNKTQPHGNLFLTMYSHSSQQSISPSSANIIRISNGRQRISKLLLRIVMAIRILRLPYYSTCCTSRSKFCIQVVGPFSKHSSDTGTLLQIANRLQAILSAGLEFLSTKKAPDNHGGSDHDHSHITG